MQFTRNSARNVLSSPSPRILDWLFRCYSISLFIPAEVLVSHFKLFNFLLSGFWDNLSTWSLPFVKLWHSFFFPLFAEDRCIYNLSRKFNSVKISDPMHSESILFTGIVLYFAVYCFVFRNVCCSLLNAILTGIKCIWFAFNCRDWILFYSTALFSRKCEKEKTLWWSSTGTAGLN